jgi:hypothetical protein
MIAPFVEYVGIRYRNLHGGKHAGVDLVDDAAIDLLRLVIVIRLQNLQKQRRGLGQKR